MTAMTTPRPAPALPHADLVIDASGFPCPMPIVKLAQAVKSVQVGQIVEVVATDPGILADAPAWAQATRQDIIGAYSEGDRHHFWFRKLHD
jgi:tRNA 2-thiouridine synthesizing protein A